MGYRPQTENQLLDAENGVVVARGGDGAWRRWGKRGQRCKLLVVTEISPGM